MPGVAYLFLSLYRLFCRRTILAPAQATQHCRHAEEDLAPREAHILPQARRPLHVRLVCRRAAARIHLVGKRKKNDVSGHYIGEIYIDPVHSHYEESHPSSSFHRCRSSREQHTPERWVTRWVTKEVVLVPAPVQQASQRQPGTCNMDPRRSLESGRCVVGRGG